MPAKLWPADAPEPPRLGYSLPPVYTHGGALDGLRDKRGLRHLDFAACDVGRGTTNADRGHNASALTRLRFNFASTPHRDTLLDREVIGRPAKIGLRCHCPDEAGTSGACRESSSMPSAGAHMRAYSLPL